MKYKKDPTAGLRLLALCSPFSPAQAVDIHLNVRARFDALRKGLGTTDDFNELAVAMNMASEFVNGKSPFAEKIAADAVDALNRAKDRHTRLGVWGLDGPGMQALDFGIDLHEQIIDNATPAQILPTVRAA